MEGIFTSEALGEIMEDPALTARQRTERVMALYQRALEADVARGGERKRLEADVARGGERRALEADGARGGERKGLEADGARGGERKGLEADGARGGERKGLEADVAKDGERRALERARAERESGRPDVRDSEEYRALEAEFAAYRALEAARASEDYRGVKPKFFETVYAMVERGDGAKPVREQLNAIRRQYEEYFIPAERPARPTFGAPVEGSMPKGDRGAVQALFEAWGFAPRRGARN